MPFDVKLKFIAGVLAFDVNTDVVSDIVTDESDDAETDNDTEDPAITVPIDPAPVENAGAVLAVIIAFVLLAALPFSNSILT